MKLTLVGGGGVRAPLFIESALRRAEWSNLTELCLLDIDEPRLELFGGLGAEIARRERSRSRSPPAWTRSARWTAPPMS